MLSIHLGYSGLLGVFREEKRRRLHEGVGNVAPGDVYHSRRKSMHEKRAGLKEKTLLERKEFNSRISETGVEIVAS